MGWGFIDGCGCYKPGDMPPTSGCYMEWHEWAHVQYNAGFRQQKCSLCGKWRFPQELRAGRSGQSVAFTGPVCLSCDTEIESKP